MDARLNLIGGQWVAGPGSADNINPSNTDDIVSQHAVAGEADVREAIAAAAEAFPRWSRSAIQQRHDILKTAADEILARKDEIGRLLSREEGKTLAEGVAETVRAAQIFRFFSGEALRLAASKLPMKTKIVPRHPF